MKDDKHSEYQKRTFTCSNCGTVIETQSTIDDDVSVETCSQCHPAYTGKQRINTSGTRVERFKSQYGDGSSKK